MLLDVEIRPARPDDVDAAVPLIYCAGEHEYDYPFNTERHTATKFNRAAFLGGPKSDSHRGLHVAVVDGRVIGIGSFLGIGEFDTANTLRLVWDMYRLYGVREFCGVLRRGLRFQGLVPPPDAEALVNHRAGGYRRSPSVVGGQGNREGVA